MHDTPMTLDAFASCLDRHGASVDTWPHHAAAPARALLEASRPARDLLAESRNMESLLASAMPAAGSTTDALRSRILAEVARQTAGERRWLGSHRILRPMTLAAALIPLFLGYAIGVSYQGGVTDQLASDVSLFAFTDYETYSDAN